LAELERTKDMEERCSCDAGFRMTRGRWWITLAWDVFLAAGLATTMRLPYLEGLHSPSVLFVLLGIMSGQYRTRIWSKSLSLSIQGELARGCFSQERSAPGRARTCRWGNYNRSHGSSRGGNHAVPAPHVLPERLPGLCTPPGRGSRSSRSVRAASDEAPRGISMNVVTNVRPRWNPQGLGLGLAIVTKS
jgi:hypothetical protein